MTGRKPKPTVLKGLKDNSGKRKLNTAEPKPESGIPSCLVWLFPEVKKKRNRLVKFMNQPLRQSVSMKEIEYMKDKLPLAEL